MLVVFLYACRIDSNFVIKVADFRLSESIYKKTCFKEEGGSHVRLPVKWMALESLTDGVFTEKTDVVCECVRERLVETSIELGRVSRNVYLLSPCASLLHRSSGFLVCLSSKTRV